MFSLYLSPARLRPVLAALQAPAERVRAQPPPQTTQTTAPLPGQTSAATATASSSSSSSSTVVPASSASTASSATTAATTTTAAVVATPATPLGSHSLDDGTPFALAWLEQLLVDARAEVPIVVSVVVARLLDHAVGPGCVHVAISDLRIVCVSFHFTTCCWSLRLPGWRHGSCARNCASLCAYIGGARVDRACTAATRVCL